MKAHILYVGLWVSLSLGLSVLAQSPIIASPASVNESNALAILGRDSIQVELPLRAAAGPSLRAVAWLISPAGAKSAETAVDIPPGTHAAKFTIPWPKDAKGQPVDEIGWYRLAYRIESQGATVAHGVLAVGAIASNLMTLRLARPEKLVPGKPLSVRVFAENQVTYRPLRGVHLKATLTTDSDDSAVSKAAKRAFTRQATTDSTGEAILEFPPSLASGDSADLTVEGAMTSGGRADAGAFSHDKITAEIDTAERIAIHIETDKPLHKPGEAVHLRALIFDDAGRAAANAALTLNISDPDNKKLIEVPLTTNNFGIAAYDWKTSAQLAPGDYDALFDLDNSTETSSTESATVRIERYELPEFSVTAAMDRGYYLSGDRPTVKIHAGYLFGKPVASGWVRIVRAENVHWDPRTGKYEGTDSTEQTTVLDGSGDASVTLDVKSDFEDMLGRDYERYADIQYRAMITDASSGRTEPRNFTVRLSRDPIHIYLNSLGSDDREGDFLLSTSYADGVPAVCKVTVDWMDANSRTTRAASVKTNKYGLAKLRLRYPASTVASEETTAHVRLIARDGEGRSTRFDDTVSTGMPDSVWISVAHSLLQPHQPIEAEVHGTPGDTMDVDVLSASGTLDHLQVRLHHASEPLTIAADARFHGLVTLRAYTMNGDLEDYGGGWSNSGGYKSVLYPEDRELKVKVAGLQSSYPPGAQVEANLQVRAAAGLPVSGAFGVSVFDTAVEQRAETEEEANERWFGWRWWDRGSVAGVTRASLDKTDTSQPIPDDLDLAAEALLANEENQAIAVEGNSDTEVRKQYSDMMAQDLKQLGAAAVAVRAVHLPATLDALRQIARDAKIDDAVLLDPWNTPYKVETSEQWTDEVVSLRSAGPDKRFGTADDFTIPIARRNLFAVPGERLAKMLQDAAAAGRPLPGTPDALKQLAQTGGLYLDSLADGTRQSNGKPYVYAFVLQRRYYSIQVEREDGTVVWISPSIDYFSRTEKRLEAAIHDWEAHGKPFPETEVEARQAFSVAGIDFDSLRDPFGKALRLRVTQLMAFSRVEHVKAAGSLEAKTKPVTYLMRAIQILRSPDPASEGSDVDIVGQFLHPLTQQTGKDLNPEAAEEGTFEGDTGAIGGTVTDTTGAVVPDATISLKTSAGVLVATAKTSEDGTYLIRDLTPGFYRLQVASPGFLSFLLSELHVSSASLTTADVELRVGAASESVTVEASRATVETDSAELAAPSQVKLTIIKTPNGAAKVSEPTFTPRLRHVFDETAYWAPSLETGKNGRAALSFRLPDSLTTWKLHALASTIDGRIGAIDQTFKTFQPFFVDLDAPQVLTVGDEIRLPVNLRNYTSHALALPVTVKAADWLTPLTPSTVQANVAANASSRVVFGFRAAAATASGPLNITAANAHEGDAVEKTVQVHPDGEPRAVAASELLRGKAATLALDIPANAIPGSVHAELLLYPNLGAEILHSMKAVLERPYGCGEQTLSSTYPSLLFLKLLRAAKASSPAEAQAQNYMQIGYDRLLGYFNPAGGLTYWGGSDHDPDAALTAYGLEFLTDAQPFVTVDRNYIEGALNWLVANQQPDGSWKPRYGDPSAAQTLYVAHALAHASEDENFAKNAPKDLRDRVKGAIARAVASAAASVAAVHNPYTNALSLDLAIAAGDGAGISRLRAELISTAKHNRDGAYWNSESLSPFYSWGHAGELETTALVLSAFEQGAQSASDRALIDDALLFLLRSKDRYGIWLSGQATVRVLQALMPMAIQQAQNPSASTDFAITVNGAPLSAEQANALQADSRLLEAPRSLDLTSMLKPGSNRLVFTSASAGFIASAEVSADYYVPWEKAASTSVQTQTGRDYGLDFGYSCDATNAQVSQPIECTVNARRFGSQSYGMLLAEVGLPPGADVDRATLGKLLDTGTICRYELEPDRIVFYLWSWRAEGSHFSFRFTPRYAIRAKAAPASLSDYYNPDLKSVLSPQTFIVQEPSAH